MPNAKAKRQPAKKPKNSTGKGSSKPKAQTISPAAAAKRRVRIPDYKSFHLQRRVKPARVILPGAFRLLGRSLLVLKRHWKLFLSIIIVYAVLNLILVRGLSGGTDLSSIKSELKGNSAGLSTGLTLFVYLLGDSNSSSSASSGVYQTLLLIIVSLALIWGLRQIYNDAAVRMRDTFYRGVYPLVPFILVLLVIALQLLPFIIGATLYSTVMTNGIAVYAIEKVLWVLLFGVLTLTSLYMLCSSVFALYVVTLPDMTPMKALRSARALVKHRRWMVLRKMLFLPIALLVLAAIIMLPIILFVTPAAGWIFLLLSMVGLAVLHSYMYALYRELLV